MKKQDIATAIGVVMGFFLVAWSMAMNGGLFKLNFGQLKLFWDVPSVLITIGGSFCALMVNYSIDQIKNLGVILLQAFKEPKISKTEVIVMFSELSKKARREGLLSLEEQINDVEDEYLRKGLQMVVDGIEPETIREILELEIGEMEGRHKTGIDFLRAWGGYAPAFGMIGTLIGLIQMLGNLTDSSQIASGMSVALITTFYGAIMANLVFNPMAQSLSLKSGVEVSLKEMMIEGILAIQSGVNPRIIQEKLVCYLPPIEKREFFKISQSEGVAE